MRGLGLMDDRGVERAVHADDLLVGEPWNAARSTEKPARIAPAVYRTWMQGLVLGIQTIFFSLVLANILRGLIGVHFFVALFLVVCTWVVLYAAYRRYGGQIHSMFWRQRRSRRTTRHALRQHARLSIVRDRVCPCCAYSLDDAVREPDGCTPCPECGAAWRLDLWSDGGGIYRPPAVTGAGQGHPHGRMTAYDARGVIVPLLARRKDLDRKDAIMNCPARPDRVRLRHSLLAWGIQLVITAGIAWFVVMILQPEDRLSWIGAVLMILLASIMLAFLVGIAYTHQLMLGTHRYLIAMLVGEGACPCCEDRLRPTPSPTDGFRICDTCGSAWSVPKQG